MSQADRVTLSEPVHFPEPGNLDAGGAGTRKATAWVRGVSAWTHAHPFRVDFIVASIFCALGLASARLVQLSVAESDSEIEGLRATAEAGLASGAAAKESAQRLLELISLRPERIAMPWIYALAILASVPLAFRRRWSASTHVVVITSFVVTMYVSPYDAQIVQGAAWLSTYSFAAYSRLSARRRNFVLVVTAVLLVLFVTGIVRNRRFYPDPIILREAIFGFVLVSMLYLSSIAFGVVMRRHRETTESLAAYASRLAAQQGELARTAILDERVRIARELHDVVAHHVSVMGMQAGAARLRLSPDDTPVRQALTTIEQSSREAVADLYRLLGLLRSEADATGHDVQSPQPSLLLLPQLIADHERAGHSITLSVEGDLERLSPVASLTSYRIIQEALTNIRKHAKYSDTGSISLRMTNEALSVVVANPAPSKRSDVAAVRTGVGLGIRGMRERAELLGGRLTARATGPGGFVVKAELPVHVQEKI